MKPTIVILHDSNTQALVQNVLLSVMAKSVENSPILNINVEYPIQKAFAATYPTLVKQSLLYGKVVGDTENFSIDKLDEYELFVIKYLDLFKQSNLFSRIYDIINPHRQSGLLDVFVPVIHNVSYVDYKQVNDLLPNMPKVIAGFVSDYSYLLHLENENVIDYSATYNDLKKTEFELTALLNLP